MAKLKLIGLLCMIHTASSPLPDIAQRVDSCPEPNNKTAWDKASKRMNCSEYSAKYNIDIIKKLLLYHCLPSHFLNETIEFCGRNTAIDKGQCPIYNYEHGATVATGQSCAKFTRGCPDPAESPYYSWTFYKYYACLDINKKHRCYHAEPNCPKKERSETTETTAKTDETSLMTSTTTVSTSSAEVDNSCDSSLWAIIGAFIVGALIGAFLCYGVVVLLFKYKRPTKRVNCPEIERMLTPINEHENGSQSSVGMDQRTTSNQVVCNENPQSEEGNFVNPCSLIKKMCDGFPDINFNILVYNLSEKMTKDECNRIKHGLNDGKADFNIFDGIEDSSGLLRYMKEKYLFSDNVAYAQTIFWGFQSFSLYNICLGYAKDRRNHVIFVEIETAIDKPKCVINCPDVYSDRIKETGIKEWLVRSLCLDDDAIIYSFDNNSEVQTSFKQPTDFPQEGDSNKVYKRLEIHMKENQSESDKKALREWIEEFNELHPYKIHQNDLPDCPDVVSYTLSCEHAEAITKYFKSDDGQIAASKKKVAKIICNEVITIGDALHESNFLHVRLRLNEKNKPNVEHLKAATSLIAEKSGLKMKGKEVYVREVSDESGENVFLEKNRECLLANLEPITLLHIQEVASCFEKDDIKMIRSSQNRRKQAEQLLKMCNILPIEKLKKVLPHLENVVSSSTTISSNSELDSARNWIQKNRDLVLEELDSDFIKSIDGVPSDALDKGKSRQIRNQSFLDFTLQKDDVMMKLYKQMVEIIKPE